MKIFSPNCIFNRIWDISSIDIENMGIKLLILDVDNTLAVCNSLSPHKNVQKWIALMKMGEVKMVILSNNKGDSVKILANKLKLPYICNAKKPLNHGFKLIQKKFNVPKNKMAIIGDQIYTDILGGNLFGIKTIWVLPMEKEKGLLFKIKRFMEKLTVSNF